MYLSRLEEGCKSRVDSGTAGTSTGSTREADERNRRSTLARPLSVRFYAASHASVHSRTEAPRQARLHHGRQRRDGDLSPARPAIQPHRAALPFAGAEARRPHRAVPGEQCALLRDLLGCPALGPDLHRHQLAADGGRGRVHRERLRRRAVHHVEVPRRTGGGACVADDGCRQPLHDRRHDRGLSVLGRDGGALSRDAHRRPDGGPRHALFVRHHRPPQGRAAGGRAAADRFRQSAAGHHAQALRHGRAHRLSLAGAALSRGAAALQHERHAAGRHLGNHGAFRRRGIPAAGREVQDHAQPARADHVRALPEAARRGAPEIRRVVAADAPSMPPRPAPSRSRRR